MVFIPRWERYSDNKPSSEVELNIGHELTDGIAVAYVFNDNIDLVSGLKGILSGGAYIENGVFHSNFGRMVIPVNRTFNNLSFIIKYRATSTPAHSSPVNVIGASNQSFVANYNHTNDSYIGVLTTVNSGWTIADLNIQGLNQATIAGTISSTTTKAFKNGALQNSYNTGFYSGLIPSIKLACNETSTKNYYGDMQIDFAYVFDKALTDEQIAELSTAPYQILKPHRKWFYFADVPVLGGMTGQEGVDTGTWSGSVPVLGGMTGQEADDTGTWSGSVPVLGGMTGQEGVDTGTWSGSVPVLGSMTGQEGVDTGSWTGSGLVSGSFAGQEADDTGSWAGSGLVSGSFTGQEADDTGTWSGSVPVLGSMTGQEGVDTGTWVGSAPVLGSMTGQEGVDTGSWTGSGLVSGSFAGQEGADTGSWVGSGLVSGSFTGQEVVDTGSWVGSVPHVVTGDIGSTEAADVIFLTGGALITGDMNVVDGHDTALFSTRDLVRIRAQFNTTLARDKQFEVQV